MTATLTAQTTQAPCVMEQVIWGDGGDCPTFTGMSLWALSVLHAHGKWGFGNTTAARAMQTSISHGQNLPARGYQIRRTDSIGQRRENRTLPVSVVSWLRYAVTNPEGKTYTVDVEIDRDGRVSCECDTDCPAFTIRGICPHTVWCSLIVERMLREGGQTLCQS